MSATKPDLLTALGVGTNEARRPGMSTCCMTCGNDAARLAAVLSALRAVSDEIVVAVEEQRAEPVASALGGIADRVLTFARGDHPDRPIPWLFESCSHEWVFNIDDDEVPSPGLLDVLPRLVEAQDVSHYWIARRWLFGDSKHYLADAPWGLEFQLRLVLADPRFVQFSDEFHRPVIAHGPARYVEQPLWHLDTLVNSFERRRAKAERYERRRRGMRIAGVAHNTGLYLPELRPRPQTKPVPIEDLAAIDEVLAACAPRGAPIRLEHSRPSELARLWPAGDALHHRGSVALVRGPSSFTADVQQTVDVRVTNHGTRAWDWGKEGRPEIRLAYRWHGPAEDDAQLRTPLPSRLEPGASQVVPLHVVAPDAPGLYRLELDLIHEHVRWFGCGVTVEVVVTPRRRVAIAGAPERVEAVLDTLALMPELEAVVVRPDARRTPGFDHREVAGLREFLGIDAPGGRVKELVRYVTRSARLLRAARRRDPRVAFVALAARCDAFVVAGLDATPEAPRTRSLWRRALTAQAARTAGARLIVVDQQLAPRGIDRVLDRLLVRGAAVVTSDQLLAKLHRELATPATAPDERRPSSAPSP